MISTFKLIKPTEGYTNKLKPFSKHGSWGNRDIQIDEILNKMI